MESSDRARVRDILDTFSINVEKVKDLLLTVDFHIIIEALFEKVLVSDNPSTKMYATLCKELHEIHEAKKFRRLDPSRWSQ